MTVVAGIDPRTGSSLEPVAVESAAAQVAAAVRGAHRARSWLQGLGRAGRAELLRSVADHLEAARHELCAVADLETGLGSGRLGAELTRTVFQLGFFADVLDEGSYLEVTIDPAGDTPMGPRPDLRRMLVPTGVVAVFGASNFPFAFSMPGGDTASALAAGCPVVVKAHGSHPGTSRLAHEAIVAAVQKHGGPDEAIGIVHGVQAGIDLVTDPLVTAVGFTGSLTGARALMAAMDAGRDAPIPFYGELSSLNPVVVTSGAARQRPEEIARGLVASVTGSAGQFCTKPGVVLVPAGEHGDALVDEVTAAMGGLETVPLLNERIHASYLAYASRLEDRPEVRPAGEGRRPDGGFHVAPAAYEIAAASLDPTLVEECFGPVVLVVRYGDRAELEAALGSVEGSLTATVHHADDDPELPALVELLGPRAGRLVFNGFPTGVVVSWAQHHGGPWPSTNALHTSVGATAIRRFLRPMTWQDAPQHVLPPELRDGDDSVPRRVDGVLRLPEPAQHPT